MMNAVDVAGVSFKYQKANVLQNISFSVPNQKIHALLGPSGSGKVKPRFKYFINILSITFPYQRRPLCSGWCSVEFGPPREWSPFLEVTNQVILIDKLATCRKVRRSVRSWASTKRWTTLPVFISSPRGTLRSSKLEKSLSIKILIKLLSKFFFRKAILTEVFRLPPDDQQIVGTLSGGQQKALSLALVFLHSPRLAILDEPTVGTDPLLGDQIWSFLHRQVDHHGLTVIIVTHYILEASLAHHVAMMRNGRLIEEGVRKFFLLEFRSLSNFGFFPLFRPLNPCT